MKYLDDKYIENFDKDIFRKAHPYPFAVFEKIVKPEAYQTLINNMPDIKHFEKSVGKERNYGQKSHDRYILEYEDRSVVPDCWNEFIEELSSPKYKKFLAKCFGTPFFKVRYHWHYSFAGCSVSPHCDGLTKLGSQIFYLNTERDWKAEWGGNTIILEPKSGKIPYTSSPEFEKFNVSASSGPLGNVSLLFQRTDNAWHGVTELKCPDDKLRKVFILVMDVDHPAQRIKNLTKKVITKARAYLS